MYRIIELDVETGARVGVFSAGGTLGVVDNIRRAPKGGWVLRGLRCYCPHRVLDIYDKSHNIFKIFAVVVVKLRFQEYCMMSGNDTSDFYIVQLCQKIINRALF